MAAERAYINGKALQWARERARYDVDAAAHVVGKKPDVYEEWEEGVSFPTMRQTRQLATAFQRPLSFFYLDRPPDEVDVVAELRRLPGQATRPVSPELAKQIRLASERRILALELYEELGETPPAFDFRASVTSNAEATAEKVRQHLGVTVAQQTATDLNSVPKMWREALENAGVLVFQVPYVEPDEMQGFAITKRPLPIVAYNSKTTYHRRIFTLFHELGHVLLDDTVLHENEVMLAPADHKTEEFCNRFAAALLVPREALLNEPQVLRKGKDAEWADHEVAQLSKAYGVSKSVIIRRLHRFSRISDGQYHRIKTAYDSYTMPPKPKQDGGDPFKNRIVHIGGLLSRLAFRNYYYNNWTVRDLSSLFNLRMSSLGRMEYEVFQQNYGFDL